jgi:hypothetical protein
LLECEFACCGVSYFIAEVRVLEGGDVDVGWAGGDVDACGW